MAQFDVYPNPSKVSQAHYPYLVDIQSNLLSELGNSHRNSSGQTLHLW